MESLADNVKRDGAVAERDDVVDMPLAVVLPCHAVGELGFEVRLEGVGGTLEVLERLFPVGGLDGAADERASTAGKVVDGVALLARVLAFAVGTEKGAATWLAVALVLAVLAPAGAAALLAPLALRPVLALASLVAGLADFVDGNDPGVSKNSHDENYFFRENQSLISSKIFFPNQSRRSLAEIKKFLINTKIVPEHVLDEKTRFARGFGDRVVTF